MLYCCFTSALLLRVCALLLLYYCFTTERECFTDALLLVYYRERVLYCFFTTALLPRASVKEKSIRGCRLKRRCVLILVYMCPHTSSYYYICVLIPPHTTIYMSSYLLILLYMCPHTTIATNSLHRPLFSFFSCSLHTY